MNIDAREIHLWFACDPEINDAGILADYFPMLAAAERQQQQRFHFEKHRHQYLITRALVRSTLSFYVPEIKPWQWVFEKNRYGKPSIENPIDLPLRFNLSHTEGIVVMAVMLAREVGVDIEWIERDGQTVEIAESFFSSREVEQLLALPAERQRGRFFDLWTLKEAYIKACGMGLSIPLDQFSFAFAENNEHDRIAISFDPQRNDQPQCWLFWQMLIHHTHKVALALKTENATKDDYSLVFRKVVPGRSVIDIPASAAPGPIELHGVC